jgi:hypothetical protein
LKIETAYSAEVDVEDDASRLAGHTAMQKLLGGSERLDRNAVETKGARERGTQGGIVIDDADP